MKRIFYLFVAFSVVMAACTKKTVVKNEAVQVKIETASMQEIDQIYEFTSTVDAAVKNYISSAGGTRIEKIRSSIPMVSTRFSKLALTLFSYPEYV